MIGQSIAHYNILEKLGSGGMGEVYLAEDMKLDRKVALKFLPDSLTQDPEARERLLREAKATSRLNHPNILTVYSVEQHDGRDYIVMEYIDGYPLDEFCKMHELPLRDLLGLTLQIGEGLLKAHESGIVHRDIKPTNILIDADRRARLLDFGLATFAGAVRLTQAGSTLGTAAYMSPEQAMSRDCDHRSDLFSLGVVLYEMIIGRLPFRGDHSAALIYAIVNEQPEPLVRYKTDVPDELQRVVAKCLAKRPEERYQSAADLVADLRSLRRDSESQPVRTIATTSTRKMLAVLPFENLGPADDEYFADGITEEIISRLAAVKELGVISRTSVMQYKDTRKPLREIGAELGADHILEGTVRWGKSRDGSSRVRITPQLIKVADDTHLWSDRYDRVLEDIFDVQTDIAEHVIEQLNITLIAPERAAIHIRPTDNLDAYHAYLRGREYMNRASYLERDFQLSVEMFNRAVQLDPNFAVAWADLSKAHSEMYHHGYDQSDARRDQSKQAMEKAEQLQPDGMETNFAKGLYYYRCHRDYTAALDEFERALSMTPNSAYLWLSIGGVRRRMGEFVTGLECLRRAFELDPLSRTILSEIGVTLTCLRRYEEADRCFQRSMEMAPDQTIAYVFHASNHLAWNGDLDSARKALESIPRDKAGDVHLFFFLYRQLLFERRFSDALEFVETLKSELLGTQPWAMAKSQLRGFCLRRLGQDKDAEQAYRTAIPQLESAIEANPDDFRLYSSLGLVYADLSDRSRAIENGERAVSLCSAAPDAIRDRVVQYQLATVCSAVGELDRACDVLEEIVSVPSWFSRKYIQLDPALDQLHGHSRFASIIAQDERVF